MTTVQAVAEAFGLQLACKPFTDRYRPKRGVGMEELRRLKSIVYILPVMDAYYIASCVCVCVDLWMHVNINTITPVVNVSILCL